MWDGVRHSKICIDVGCLMDWVGFFFLLKASPPSRGPVKWFIQATNQLLLRTSHVTCFFLLWSKLRSSASWELVWSTYRSFSVTLPSLILTTPVHKTLHIVKLPSTLILNFLVRDYILNKYTETCSLRVSLFVMSCLSHAVITCLDIKGS